MLTFETKDDLMEFLLAKREKILNLRGKTTDQARANRLAGITVGLTIAIVTLEGLVEPKRSKECPACKGSGWISSRTDKGLVICPACSGCGWAAE